MDEATRRDSSDDITLYEFLRGKTGAPADALAAPATDARPHFAALPWRGTGTPGIRDQRPRIVGMRDKRSGATLATPRAR
jgi:hypothetical protein